jgi:hypothetical protein
MGRSVRFCFLLVGASALAAAASDARAQSRGLVPMGGMWQSIPYTDEPKDGATRAEPAMPAPAKATRIAAAPKAARRPVAASTPEEPPRASAAAKTLELARRIDALSPGTKLDQPIHDPQNPPWRRARPGAAGPDGRELSLPFDDTGRAGFVARGYHQDPNWENPRGNVGATFGLRTRF